MPNPDLLFWWNFKLPFILLLIFLPWLLLNADIGRKSEDLYWIFSIFFPVFIPRTICSDDVMLTFLLTISPSVTSTYMKIQSLFFLSCECLQQKIEHFVFDFLISSFVSSLLFTPMFKTSVISCSFIVLYLWHVTSSLIMGGVKFTTPFFCLLESLAGQNSWLQILDLCMYVFQLANV